MLRLRPDALSGSLRAVKNQYVGDQNDFAKYQLLRICGAIFEQVLVAWMLTEDDDRTDGRRVGYLDRAEEWREADVELFDCLRALVSDGKRSVAAVQEAKILPGCSFESELVPTAHVDRATYFQRLADRAGKGSLVFFDPDNGLEVASVAKYRRGAEKYLFWDELALFREAGASVLIYQHFPRVNRATYTEAALARLQVEMGNGHLTYAVHTSHVAFLFAVHSPYEEPLRRALVDRCSASAMLSLVEGP